jgi:hypothetical protein
LEEKYYRGDELFVGVKPPSDQQCFEFFSNNQLALIDLFAMNDCYSSSGVSSYDEKTTSSSGSNSAASCLSSFLPASLFHTTRHDDDEQHATTKLLCQSLCHVTNVRHLYLDGIVNGAVLHRWMEHITTIATTRDTLHQQCAHHLWDGLHTLDIVLPHLGTCLVKDIQLWLKAMTQLQHLAITSSDEYDANDEAFPFSNITWYVYLCFVFLLLPY